MVAHGLQKLGNQLLKVITVHGVQISINCALSLFSGFFIRDRNTFFTLVFNLYFFIEADWGGGRLSSLMGLMPLAVKTSSFSVKVERIRKTF